MAAKKKHISKNENSATKLMFKERKKFELSSQTTCEKCGLYLPNKLKFTIHKKYCNGLKL